MAPKNVISIVIDRLHAGMVGAYGNSWIRTVALDRLAAESFLFDQAFANSLQLGELYRAYWLGTHRAVAESSERGAALPRIAADSGLHTALVTDEPEVAGLPTAVDFVERVFVEPHDPDRTCHETAQTGLARLFETVTTWIAAPPKEPFFLWAHSRGMAGAWDAPRALRNQYADDEDPEPPTFVSIPDERLPEDCDPDYVLGIKHAYAGQVAALDECLAAFCEQFTDGGLAANTQLTFLSARGFPLGEHGRIGACDEALYNEGTQLVWLMRFPDAMGQLARSQALVQPSDLPGTLLEGLELDRRRLGAGRATSLLEIIERGSALPRDRVFLQSLHDQAIRTPAWYLRKPDDGPAELYAKPSDRWEVNEVARLLPDVVAGLEAALDEIQTAPLADSLPPLAEPLVSEVD